MIENLSIIIPALNEEESIPILLDEIENEIENLNINYEIILVDDGSDKYLKDYIKKRKNITVLRNNSPKGQTFSIEMGIRESNFNHVCLMDGDGQNPPSEIKKLISLYNQHQIDVASGIRLDRKDGSNRKYISKFANYLVRKITKTKSQDIGCSLKIFDKKIVDDVDFTGDIHRILVTLLEMRGYKIKQINIEHKKREKGQTSYSYNRTLPVLIDAFLLNLTNGFVRTPRYALGKLSFYFLFGSIVSFVISLVQKLSLDVYVHRNPIFLIGITLFFVSIQLFVFSVSTVSNNRK